MPGSNNNEEVLHISPGTSPSDCLVSYPKHAGVSNGFSQKSERQQVSSVLQDPPKYSSWSFPHSWELFKGLKLCLILLGTKCYCFSFLWFMGGASDNHVTVGHVTVWEASSRSFFDHEGHRDWTSTSTFVMWEARAYESPYENLHYTRQGDEWQKLHLFNKSNFCRSSPCS